MSPLNKEQLDKIRDERKKQIKKVALRIFARNGYSGTKTSVIASEANISEGLIYKYFDSKEELFSSIVKELFEAAVKEFEYLYLIQGSPFEQIKTLTENMIAENNKYSFMLIERARKDDDVPEKVKVNYKHYSAYSLLDKLIPIFIKGQEMGEFSLEDPRKLASWYFSIVNSVCMHEWDEDEYGIPSAEILMRILKK